MEQLSGAVADSGNSTDLEKAERGFAEACGACGTLSGEMEGVREAWRVGGE